MTKALDLYRPEEAKTLAALAAKQAEAFDTTMRGVDIPTAKWAVDAAKEVRAKRRAFEAERDRINKPLRAVLNDNSKEWSPTIKLLKGLEGYLKGEALAIEQAHREEQIKALQAADSTEAVAAVAVPVESGLGKRTTWGWEVVDPDKVPDEYWVLDTDRLDREAKEQKDQLAVPGIRPVKRTVGVLR